MTYEILTKVDIEDVAEYGRHLNSIGILFVNLTRDEKTHNVIVVLNDKEEATIYELKNPEESFARKWRNPYGDEDCRK